MACPAVDAGFTLTVESAQLTEPLLDGRWVNEFPVADHSDRPAPERKPMAPDTPAPTPQGPPTTPDQAVQIVLSRYAQPRLPDGTPAELHVHEFDIGYLVYAVFPPPAETAGPPRPAPPGGAKIVVSKETGETVTVPNFPTEQAIALYRKNLERNA